MPYWKPTWGCMGILYVLFISHGDFVMLSIDSPGISWKKLETQPIREARIRGMLKSTHSLYRLQIKTVDTAGWLLLILNSLSTSNHHHHWKDNKPIIHKLAFYHQFLKPVPYSTVAFLRNYSILRVPPVSIAGISPIQLLDISCWLLSPAWSTINQLTSMNQYEQLISN